MEVVLKEYSALFTEIGATVSPFVAVCSVVALAILIVQYVRCAKNKAIIPRLLEERAERAEKEGRVIDAVLDHSHIRGVGYPRYTRYVYYVDGHKYNRTWMYRAHRTVEKTIRLYYDNDPRRAVTHDKYTLYVLRMFWPWITTLLICLPFMFLFENAGLLSF